MQAGETPIELAKLRMILEGLFSPSLGIFRALLLMHLTAKKMYLYRCGVKMLPRRRAVLGRPKGDGSLLCRQ
jgi:hypothetical protein